jgi:hypothetical protein
MKTGALSHRYRMAKGENKKWACAHWCASPKPVLHNSSEVNNTPEGGKRQTLGSVSGFHYLGPRDLETCETLKPSRYE